MSPVGRDASTSTSGVFLAVRLAIQPRLLSSPATKNSPAMPVRMVCPRSCGALSDTEFASQTLSSLLRRQSPSLRVGGPSPPGPSLGQNALGERREATFD